MSDDSDNVTKLNVRFKNRDHDGPMLKVVSTIGTDKCNHRDYIVPGTYAIRNVQYLIRDGETEVECGNCGTRLDPMFVLRALAGNESRWMETAKKYQEEMQRLNERSRTKCRHCGKMTKISRG